jgi:hypothetical protein
MPMQPSILSFTANSMFLSEKCDNDRIFFFLILIFFPDGRSLRSPRTGFPLGMQLYTLLVSSGRIIDMIKMKSLWDNWISYK